MDIKVQIISRETIKPSSPTPTNLTHKLSILDQLVPSRYIPFVLFYSATSQNSIKTSDHLKKSLAETLTHFYPFAGRVKNGSHIDCNDNGATYIEAHVANDMSMVLKQPDIGQLIRLLPTNPNEFSPQIEDKEILAVQVNYFSCGGMAIGVCVHHMTADASSAATFIKSWAAISSGANDINAMFYDCTSLFPPLDTSAFSWGNYTYKDSLLKHVMKRFVFESSKIVALKAKIGNGPYLVRPTRFESVSALIWGALMSAIRERDKTTKDYVAVSIVDLRKRLKPPLPGHCIGNICQGTPSNCSIENVTNYNELAGKIRESISNMSDEYVRKLHKVDGYLNYVKAGAEQFGRSEIRVYIFSSWCRFPYYEADFGWGKPIWIGAPFWQNTGAVFLDAPDGEGIEVWLGMTEEDMTRLEQHPDIQEYVSFVSN